MSAFEARIHALAVEPHPNADRLELAAVGGYRCVVGKGQFADGDLAAYIPEGALCPDWLIADLGLEGKLAGPEANRVKALVLRGALSEGLVYPVREGRLRGRAVAVGDDVTELLEIEKYVPPIPVHMSGQVRAVHGATLKYDIEPYKRHLGVLREGEPVCITEKLHGTWCCLGVHPAHGPIVTSKGLSGRGLAFDLDEAAGNADNLYVKAWRRLEGSIRALADEFGAPVHVLGEVFGKGVQDLHYGRQAPDFAAFDVHVGEPGEGRYLDAAEFRPAVARHGLEPVPVLHEGPFSHDALMACVDGGTSFGAGHIREGAVVRPAAERRDPAIGRVLLKCTSGGYLTRRGGTEHA